MYCMHKFNFLSCSFVCLIFLANTLFSQEPDWKRIISEIERGETEKAKILLVSLEKDNPNSVNLKFLKALLSEDGTEAAKLYRDVVFAFEDSDFKDDALFKLYQYHYSRSEFGESDKYARMLRDTYPNSEYLNYLKRETHSAPRLQKQQNFEQVDLSDNSTKSTQTINTIVQAQNRFSIQVGAFSTESNAQRYASQFSGYQTRIREKEIGGKKLFVVLVGEYPNEIDAKNEVQKLKSRFNVDGIIVSSN